MKNLVFQLICLLFCLLFNPAHMIAKEQNEGIKKRTARISAKYVQEYDEPGKLVATLKVREKQYMVLPGAQLKLINLQDSVNVILDTVTTDKDGEAVFPIRTYPGIHRDSAGVISCIVEYEGDSQTKASEKKVEFIQARFDILFYQTDSIKYVELDAGAIVSEGEVVPINDMDVQFSIKGLFSLLPFEKATTNSQGKATVEFPSYMPGDTAGVLTVVALVDDHNDYGTVKAAGRMNWAKVVPLPVEEHRGLGDTDAPLWMVYTLIILLSAVWFHYLYVTWQVIKIKLVGKGVL